MSVIETIKLPVVAGTATVGEAFKLLRKMGTSAVVTVDQSGPVVLTDRSLHNTQVTKGPETPVSDVSRLAFPLASDQDAVSTVRRLLGRLPGRAAPVHRTVLAADQDNYVVRDFDTNSATVVTQSSRAAALLTPSPLADKSGDAAE